jgi:hypothetical protein
MHDLKLNLNNIGKVVQKEIESTIKQNRANGIDLKDKTKQRKAQNKEIKLYEYGDLAEGSKVVVNNDSVEIGYDETPHEDKQKRKDDSKGKGKISLSSLAEVHNEGKGVCPIRSFLFEGNSWLNQYKEKVKAEIKKQYQKKGII